MKYYFINPGKVISICIVVVVTAMLASCNAGSGDGLDENGQTSTEPTVPGTGGTTPTSSVFTRIQEEILTPECATSGCHNGTTSPLGLNLIDGKAYGKLVNKPSNQVDGLLLVEPSNVDASYLVHKLEGTQGGGAQMPIGRPALSADQIDLIKNWINDGALEPGSDNPDEPGSGNATLSNIQTTIFDTQCISCHSGENPAGTLNLEEGNSRSQLVGRALQFDPDGSILVVPRDADNSLLINKLTGEGLGNEQDVNYKGQRMPLSGPYLNDSEIQQIKDWINTGALDD